jgi:hypothetical protein
MFALSENNFMDQGWGEKRIPSNKKKKKKQMLCPLIY